MISVLIPNFNGIPYIEECVDSLSEQLEFGDEIVIVDDHSTDDSLPLLKKLSERNPSLVISINPSRGGASARNHALSISKNPWIQWLDIDDFLGRDKLRHQRLKLEDHPNSIAVSPFVPFIGDPENGTIQENRDWDCSEIVTGADWLASERMTIPACWFGPRRIFEKAGPWDTQLKINQDGEYFARVLAAAESVIFTPNVNVWYRRGNSESVSRFTAEKAASLFTSIDSIHRTALTLEDSDRMRQMVANRYQQAIYTAYPHCPDGLAKAKRILRNLPKPNISNPNAVSLLSRIISTVFGWRTLTKLRLLRNKLSS